MVCLVCGARRAHQEPMLSLKARNCGSLIAESGNPTLQAVAALKARMDGEPASLTFLILPIFIGVNELVTNEILIRRTTLIDQAVDLPARCLSVARSEERRVGKECGEWWSRRQGQQHERT